MNMRDISHKTRTLRIATASARLSTDVDTIARLRTGDLPKGDPLPVARIAGIMAAKNTSQLIPYCHPLPIDYVGIDFTVNDTSIEILAEVKAIHRTGVEMEALAAVSIAALTIYDMLKAIDPETMTIEAIMLVSKKGGKSQLKLPTGMALRAGILVISDSVAAGEKTDAAGQLIGKRLRELGIVVEASATVADEPGQIESLLKSWCDERHLDLIVTTGGTGLGAAGHRAGNRCAVDRPPPAGGGRSHARPRARTHTLRHAIARDRRATRQYGTD